MRFAISDVAIFASIVVELTSGAVRNASAANPSSILPL